MKIRIYLLSICFFLFSCSPTNYSKREVAEWERGLYLEEGGKYELERYFKLLKADEIYVGTVLDEEDYSESLELKIQASQLLDEKLEKKIGLNGIFERLAFLTLSRMAYANSYETITIRYFEETDVEIASRSFASSELNLPNWIGGEELLEETDFNFDEEGF
ncbi:MAG: hypothetical protein AAFR87_06655 [Bacteroidota bacterium]